MHIFSHDQYFIAGLQQILFFSGLDKSPEIVVFDPEVVLFILQTVLNVCVRIQWIR